MDVFGGNRRAVGAGRAEVAAAELERRGTLVTLLGEVARNYADLRGSQRRLALANANIRVQTDVLNITRDRFQNGLTSELDVQQASTCPATTRAEVPALGKAVQTSIHRLLVHRRQPSCRISLRSTRRWAAVGNRQPHPPLSPPAARATERLSNPARKHFATGHPVLTKSPPSTKLGRDTPASEW